MNEFDELKQQCEKISNNFRREVQELWFRADDLIESAKYIDYLVMNRDVSRMQNIVKIHREVTEDEE